MIDKSQLQQQIAAAALEVRATNPMAGSITNTVTINFVANAQIAVGGSAAMVYLPDEGEFLANAGGATYINVGTLFPIYKETLPRTARALHEAGKPWVLDPVAIGIGEMRTDLLAQFKEFKPTIIRGNASEGSWRATAAHRRCAASIPPRRSTRRARQRWRLPAIPAARWRCRARPI